MPSVGGMAFSMVATVFNCEDLVFSLLVWHGQCSACLEMQLLMNPRIPGVTACVAAAVSFFPSMALAHPGHAHPDETDEFDFFLSQVFHSHGLLDYVIIAVMIGSLLGACFAEKQVLRICALVAGLGSLSLLSLFP